MCDCCGIEDCQRAVYEDTSVIAYHMHAVDV